MSVASLIRTARERHGLDQRSLARRAGTSQGQISKIERGVVSPSISTVERLLGVMGERLELKAVPGPRPNESTRELRRDYDELSVEERVAQAASQRGSDENRRRRRGRVSSRGIQGELRPR